MSSEIQAVTAAARARTGEARAPDTQGAAHRSAAGEREQMNRSIVESTLAVSIEAGNAPLTLLLRSAIDRINELLAPELGPDAIQTAAAQQDNSPEATAARIVSLSTAFFDAYRQQHPDKTDEELIADFMSLIRKGFEQGFRDAQQILDGLGVLDGNIAAGIDRTYALVQEGYAEFESRYAQPATGA